VYRLCTELQLQHIADSIVLLFYNHYSENKLLCGAISRKIAEITTLSIVQSKGLDFCVLSAWDGQEFKKSRFVEGLSCLGLMTDNI
jgi:hypothetical protein